MNNDYKSADDPSGTIVLYATGAAIIIAIIAICALTVCDFEGARKEIYDDVKPGAVAAIPPNIMAIQGKTKMRITPLARKQHGSPNIPCKIGVDCGAWIGPAADYVAHLEKIGFGGK